MGYGSNGEDAGQKRKKSLKSFSLGVVDPQRATKLSAREVSWRGISLPQGRNKLGDKG